MVKTMSTRAGGIRAILAPTCWRNKCQVTISVRAHDVLFGKARFLSRLSVAALTPFFCFSRYQFRYYSPILVSSGEKDLRSLEGLNQIR